jgi:hypothetical protein
MHVYIHILDENGGTSKSRDGHVIVIVTGNETVQICGGLF